MNKHYLVRPLFIIFGLYYLNLHALEKNNLIIKRPLNKDSHLKIRNNSLNFDYSEDTDYLDCYSKFIEDYSELTDDDFSLSEEFFINYRNKDNKKYRINEEYSYDDSTTLDDKTIFYRKNTNRLDIILESMDFNSMYFKKRFLKWSKSNYKNLKYFKKMLDFILESQIYGPYSIIYGLNRDQMYYIADSAKIYGQNFDFYSGLKYYTINLNTKFILIEKSFINNILVDPTNPFEINKFIKALESFSLFGKTLYSPGEFSLNQVITKKELAKKWRFLKRQFKFLKKDDKCKCVWIDFFYTNFIILELIFK